MRSPAWNACTATHRCRYTLPLRRPRHARLTDPLRSRRTPRERPVCADECVTPFLVRVWLAITHETTLSGSKCAMSVPTPHTPATWSRGTDSTCDWERFTTVLSDGWINECTPPHPTLVGIASRTSAAMHSFSDFLSSAASMACGRAHVGGLSYIGGWRDTTLQPCGNLHAAIYMRQFPVSAPLSLSGLPMYST